VILANLVVGENVVPEVRCRKTCTPEKARRGAAATCLAILSVLRRKQVEAFAKIDRHHVDRQRAGPACGRPTSCWRRLRKSRACRGSTVPVREHLQVLL